VLHVIMQSMDRFQVSGGAELAACNDSVQTASMQCFSGNDQLHRSGVWLKCEIGCNVYLRSDYH